MCPAQVSSRIRIVRTDVLGHISVRNVYETRSECHGISVSSELFTIYFQLGLVLPCDGPYCPALSVNRWALSVGGLGRWAIFFRIEIVDEPSWAVGHIC
jgi:hypothetical protein